MIAPREFSSVSSRIGSDHFVKDDVGLWADIPAFTAFAQEVRQSLLGNELQFSKRRELMKQAAHLGIRKFDANLIIAMVQNRAQASSGWAQEASNGPSIMAVFATLLATQSIIVVVGWWLLA